MSTLRCQPKKPKPKNEKHPKKGKTTNTTAPSFPLSYTLSFVFCHFLQRDFYYTLRFRFVSSRLVQFSYIYFACNSFPFIFTCIYRQTVPRICVWDSVLGFSDSSLCCCFYFARSPFDAAFFFMCVAAVFFWDWLWIWIRFWAWVWVGNWL